MSGILPSAAQRGGSVPSGCLLLEEEKDDCADGKFVHRKSVFRIAAIDSFELLYSSSTKVREGVERYQLC